MMPGGIATIWRNSRRQTRSMSAAIPSSKPLAIPGELLEEDSNEELPDHPVSGSPEIGTKGSDARSLPVDVRLPMGRLTIERETVPTGRTRLVIPLPPSDCTSVACRFTTGGTRARTLATGRDAPLETGDLCERKLRPTAEPATAPYVKSDAAIIAMREGASTVIDDPVTFVVMTDSGVCRPSNWLRGGTNRACGFRLVGCMSVRDAPAIWTADVVVRRGLEAAPPWTVGPRRATTGATDCRPVEATCVER